VTGDPPCGQFGQSVIPSEYNPLVLISDMDIFVAGMLGIPGTVVVILIALEPEIPLQSR
jgi:hypothetical protein